MKDIKTSDVNNLTLHMVKAVEKLLQFVNRTFLEKQCGEFHHIFQNDKNSHFIFNTE